MRTTRVTQQVNAPRAAVYRALLDENAVAIWKVPSGMSCQVHSFDPRIGGKFRISLTYDALEASGKTSAHTDTYRGRFLELLPNERVVEIDEFESTEPSLRGEMRVTFELADCERGTRITGIHEGIPPGISLEDNEKGWKMALKRLAELLESHLSAE